MKYMSNIVSVFFLLLGAPVLAEEAPASDEAAQEAGADTPKIWSADVELGAVVTSGNTEQENFKFIADVVRDGEQYVNSVHIDGLRSSENEVVTAQKYYAYYQLDYKLEGDHSLFGRVAYEQDDFSGFEYQADVSVGYSRLLMMSNSIEWHADVGVGARESKLDDDTGTTEEEVIARVATDFVWQVSESSRFRQFLSAEIGEESTITRSETSIRSNIAGNLAMKAAFIVKHQSEVPLGSEETDTEAAITLVYTL